MVKRNLFLKLGAFMIAASILTGYPALTYAAQGTGSQAVPQTMAINVWHPAPAKANMGSLVWINYNGGSYELNVDLDGQSFKVAPDANNIPGRTQMDVTPGTHTFTVSVANLGTISQTVDVKAGQVIGLDFFGKMDIPSHGTGNNTDHPTGTRGEATANHENDNHAPVPQVASFDDLLMSQQDLTLQAK
jgi:hypothetical protein